MHKLAAHAKCLKCYCENEIRGICLAVFLPNVSTILCLESFRLLPPPLQIQSKLALQFGAAAAAEKNKNKSVLEYRKRSHPKCFSMTLQHVRARRGKCSCREGNENEADAAVGVSVSGLSGSVRELAAHHLE